jgi:hypothetical protein
VLSGAVWRGEGGEERSGTPRRSLGGRRVAWASGRLISGRGQVASASSGARGAAQPVAEAETLIEGVAAGVDCAWFG